MASCRRQELNFGKDDASSATSTSDNEVLCTLDYLLGISRTILLNEQRPLARQLELSDQTIEYIQMTYKYDGPSEIPYQILKSWKESKGLAATQNAIDTALQRIRSELGETASADSCARVAEINVNGMNEKLKEILEEAERHQKEIYVKLELPQQAPWVDKILPIEELYINLEMHTVRGEFEDTKGTPIKLEQLFDATEKKMDPCRILVEGPPGMGKTTLCWKVLNDYGLQRDYLVSKFKLVFLLFLRDIKNLESIENVLVKACQWRDYSSSDIFNCIYKYQQQILLILDGYDELSEEGKGKLHPLLRKDKFPSMFVVVTSRSGIFQMNREKETGMGEASQFVHMQNRKLQLFNKRVVIKGVSEEDVAGFLKKYLGDTPTMLEKTAKFRRQREMKEMCKCPLFLVLLATTAEEETFHEITSKTATYKHFFKFVIRRSLVRERLLEVNEEIDIFKPRDNHPCRELIIRFGKVGLNNLIQNNLTFNEQQISREDSLIFKLGLLIKTLKLERHSAENYYEPIHKSFIEFSAAFYLYNVFRDSGERAFKTEIDRVTRDGLLPTGDSLFFVFIGGFLKDRASLLFEALLPHCSWFNIQNLCFTNTLMEIEDVHNFMDSFRPLLPSFVPSFYSFGGGFNSIGRDFTSSPIHSLLLNSALQQPNLVHCLEWAPSHSISIHENVIINHLRLCLTADFCAEEDVLSGENSLKCKTLSLRLTNSFQMERWPNVVGVVDCIERETTGFDLEEGEGGLNSSVLVALHKELTKGQWKGKIIHRIRFQLKEKDDPLCLRLLLDLVTNNKIKDGVFVWIEKWAKSEREKRQISLDLQELFHSVVQSKTVDDLLIINADSTCSPVFDLSRYNRDDNIRFKSLYLTGSLSVLNETANAKPLTEEAIILCWGGEEKNSKLIQSLQGIKWLWCRMACFDFLVDDKYPGLQKLEELALIVDESLSLSPAISSLLQLRVLTLNFIDIKRIARGSSDVAFTRLLSSLSLRIIQLINIPRDVWSFDWLIACVVKGLEERKEKSNAPPPWLHEFLFYFAPGSGWDWNDLKASGGVNGIRRMLLTHLVRQCSWVNYSGDLPRALPRSLFPLDDKFTIKVDVYGADSSSSRLSQYEYRWMFMRNKYCITCTGE